MPFSSHHLGLALKVFSANNHLPADACIADVVCRPADPNAWKKHNSKKQQGWREKNISKKHEFGKHPERHAVDPCACPIFQPPTPLILLLCLVGHALFKDATKWKDRRKGRCLWHFTTSRRYCSIKRGGGNFCDIELMTTPLSKKSNRN